MFRKSVAALAAAVALRAFAASPGAITIRVPCELPGVAGAPSSPTQVCEHLSGWFDGRIDWMSDGAVLYSEYGPFLAVRASQTGRPGPADTRAAAELVVFADGNGAATEFETLYAGAATSILRDPGSLRIAIYVLGVDGQYQLAVEQPFVPVASALWAVHSLDTDALLGDLEAERAAREAADGALGARVDAEGARALAAEEALAAGLDAERDRALGAEGALQASISAANASLVSYQALLASPGVVNDPVNPVDFARLKNVPARVIGGYAAGPGISIAGDQIALAASFADGSAYDPRFVNAAGDTVAQLAVSGQLCLDASCRTGWQRVSTFLQAGASACTCTPAATFQIYCCKSFWTEDTLGCIDGNWNTHPSNCGTHYVSTWGACSCTYPAVSVGCPWVGGSQGMSELAGCAQGTLDPAARDCDGSGGTASAEGGTGGSVTCDCSPDWLGTCAVACTRTIYGSPVASSGTSATAVCAKLE